MKKSTKFDALKLTFQDPWLHALGLGLFLSANAVPQIFTRGKCLKPVLGALDTALDMIPLSIAKTVLRPIVLFVGIPFILGRLFRRIARGTQLSDHMLTLTDLKNKNVVITGANTGIGLAAAKQCADWGANVIITGRSESKCKQAVEQVLKKVPNCECQYMVMDLADLNSVKMFAENLMKKEICVDYLLLNAGLNSEYSKTKQGYETMTGVNHLGHFLLVHMILDDLKKWNTRVISTSSMGHCWFKFYPEKQIHPFDFIKDGLECEEKNFVQMLTYAHSKFLNIIHMKTLQRIFDADKTTTATAFSLHPGAILTEFTRDMKGITTTMLMNQYTCKTVEEGAATMLYVVAEKSGNLVPGGYYSNCRETKPIGEAFDVEFAQDVWDKSTKICQEFLKSNK